MYVFYVTLGMCILENTFCSPIVVCYKNILFGEKEYWLYSKRFYRKCVCIEQTNLFWLNEILIFFFITDFFVLYKFFKILLIKFVFIFYVFYILYLFFFLFFVFILRFLWFLIHFFSYQFAEETRLVQGQTWWC